MDIWQLLRWLVQPTAIAVWLIIGGITIKVWLEKYTWSGDLRTRLRPFSFIGEALVIVGFVEVFMGITFIKNAILEGVRETLIDYRFIDDLTDDAHRKILTRIIANKFDLSEQDPIVAFYSEEFSDSLILPRVIQDKKVTYIVSLDKESRELYLTQTIDKTVFLGGQAFHKDETMYPGVFDYTLRINGKDCVKFHLNPDKNSKPPDAISKKIGEITCQFTSTLESQSPSYYFISTISSSANKGEKAGFYLKQSARMKDARLTNFIALAERIKNVEVTVTYPSEECRVAISGFGKFGQEAKEAQKQHDNNLGDEFHHMFVGEYGPDSVLYLSVDCSEKTKV